AGHNDRLVATTVDDARSVQVDSWEAVRRTEDLRFYGDLAGHGCGDQCGPVLLQELDDRLYT
ncbi:MAG: hypothetical protein OXB92_16065, partial [Acidimicrobiaceae bacterium]|nr:hypothetical protein [Acidimicrobiaceae bacterium]